eukprot:8155166-Pyramimonas_sp.AAC.1
MPHVQSKYGWGYAIIMRRNSNVGGGTDTVPARLGNAGTDFHYGSVYARVNPLAWSRGQVPA